MTGFIVSRVSYSVVAFWGVLTIVFALLHASGDPMTLLAPVDASPRDIREIRHSYGLDSSLGTQYAQLLVRVLRGDLGYSYRYKRPVTELLRSRLPATIELALSGLAVALLGIPLGVLAALRRGSSADALAMLSSLVGLSVPSFWLGLILIIVFGVNLGWLPVSGYGGLEHLLMPAVVLGGFYAAQFSRLGRTSFLEVISQDYIRTARAKGLSDRSVMIHHALRNAALAILTLLGLSFGRMLGGAVIVESIFAWPGMGRLAVNAVLQRDFPVVLGSVILGAAVFLAVNLVVDFAYGWIDPRLRAAAASR